MKHLSILYFLLLAGSGSLFATDPNIKSKVQPFAVKDVFRQNVFLQNNDIIPDYKGEHIGYYVSNSTMTAYFTPTGVLYKLAKTVPLTHAEKEENEKREEKEGSKEAGEVEISRKPVSTIVEMHWSNANPNPVVAPLQKSDVSYTYVKGNNSKDYVGLSTSGYQQVVYQDVYPGVDVQYTIPEKGGLEYNLIVHPGADLSQVKIDFGGEIKKVSQDADGNVTIHTAYGDIIQHSPVSYQGGTKIASAFTLKGKSMSFDLPSGYDKSQMLTIDPWVSNLTTLTTSEIGYDVDYDAGGNLYVYGGAGSATNELFSVAKYNFNGTGISYTFGGNIASINWQTTGGTSGEYDPSNFAVDKGTSKVYIGQGAVSGGTEVIRLNAAGAYDNFESTLNSDFVECWGMVFDCQNSSILIGGGSWSDDINIGVLNPTTATVTGTNITGITSTIRQDIACLTQDPAGNTYVIFSPPYFTAQSPSTGNYIYKVNSTYTGNLWGTYSGYTGLEEFHDHPTFNNIGSPGASGNGFNCLSSNNTYLYYYNGKVLAAFSTATGLQVGNAFSMPSGYDTLLIGGVATDICNHVYVGGIGAIKTFTFNGSVFLPGADIPLGLGLQNDTVYDVKYDVGDNSIYVTGTGFAGVYNATLSISCTTNQFTTVPQTFCDSARVTVHPATSAILSYTYIWYDSVGTIVQQTNSTADTINSITGQPQGMYIVDVFTNLNCASSVVSDTVYIGPHLALTHQDTTICAGTTISIAATPNIPGGTYAWTPGGSTSSSITVSPTTSTNYIVTYTSPTCGPATDTIHVTIVPRPTLTVTDQNICIGDTVTVIAVPSVAGGTYSWTPGGFTTDSFRVAPGTATNYIVTYTAPNCGVVTDTAHITPVPKPVLHTMGDTICGGDTVHISATASVGGGTYTWLPYGQTGSSVAIPSGSSGEYYVSYDLNGCVVEDSAGVSVTPSPNAGPDQSLVLNSYAYMAATPLTGTWSQLSTNPVVTTISNPTYGDAYMYGFTALGTYGYVWTVNGCTDTVYIYIVNPDSAGPNQTICQNGTVTMAATYTIYGGYWDFISGPATPTIALYYEYNTTVTGFSAIGTYIFTWENYYNYTIDTVKIIVEPPSNGGPSQYIGVGSSTSFAATGTGTWTTVPGNPATTTISNPSSPTSPVSGFSVAGTYAYVWTTTGGCPDTVYIYVGISDGGPDQVICTNGSGASVSATMAAIGTGTWSQLSGNPAVVNITNPASPTTTMTGFTAAGVYYFVWQSPGLLPDTVTVTISAQPSAGINQTLVTGSYAYMNASPTIGGTWTTLSSNPAPTTISDPTYAYAYMYGFTTDGVYGFVWTVNGCSDTMYVTITNPAYAGPNQTVCIGATATMDADSTGYGGAWYFVHGPSTPTIHNAGSYTATITGLTTVGVYSFRWYNYYYYTFDTMTITVVAAPVAGPNQSIQSGATATMAATGTGTWTALPANPAATTITNPTSPTSTVTGFTVAGTYCYSWTNAGGCSDTMCITVTAGAAGPDQTICQYTTTSMDATGTGTWTQAGTLPSVITFTNPNSPTTTMSDFNVAGTYTFIWAGDSMNIVVTAKPNAGPDQTICLNATATMAAVAATGTLGTWSQMSGGPATCTITTPSSPFTTITGFTVAGVYDFIWTAHGCTDTVQVTVSPPPNAGPAQTICQNSTATMAGVGSGTWTQNAGNPASVTFANANSATTTVTGFTVTGTYTMTWTVNGCTATTTITVTAAPTVSVNSTAICIGGNAVLTATPTVTGGSYSWAPGGGTAQSITVSPSTTTTYTVTYSLAGCSTAIDSGVVTVSPPPTITVNNDTICLGSSATLTGTPSQTGGSYSWSPGGATSQAITVSPASNTTYTVTYSLTGCANVTASGSVNVTTPPTVSFNQATICAGNSATLTAIPTITGGSYSWAPGGATTASITVSPATTTTYTVTYAIPGSVCPAATASGAVTVTPAPVVTVNNAALCAGGNATLTATPNVTGGNYTWAPGGATTQSITVSPASTATYTVTYVVVGCGTSVDSGVVTVSPPPTVTVDSASICAGSNATITATPSQTGGTYSWSPGSYTTQNITVSPASTTTYAVTYSLSGCPNVTASGVVDVTVPPTVSVNDAAICAGQNATLNATVSQAGGTYSWAPGGATTSGITVSPATTTTYTVSYAIPLSVCPAVTASGIVTVTPQPTISMDDTTICTGLSVTLSPTVSEAGGTYSWAPGGATTPSITVTPASNTTYTVTYSLATCPLITDSSVVTLTTPPTATVSTTTAICSSPDGTATVQVSGGTSPYTYVWSDALSSTTVTLTGELPGSYTVTVTDQARCTVAATGTIGDTIIPLTITDTLTQITCYGVNNGYLSISVANCQNCEYAWSNGALSNAQIDLPPGTYTVTATDVHGCSATASYTITQPAPATLGILPVDTTVVEDSSVVFTPVFGPYPGSAIVSYLWSPAMGLSCTTCAQPVFSSSSGTYTYSLVITYNQGCQITDTVTVLAINQHFIYVPNAFTPNGDGINDVFQVFPKGGVRYMNLSIFDRWGEKVFETEDPASGWDGTYRGQMEEPGLFVYILKLTFDDNYSISNKGSITLIR